MNDLFARLVLGHVLGDYLFQTDRMAVLKNVKGLTGHIWCTIHVLIYSTCMCLFLWKASPLVFAIVFISHWPIDRWSLGLKWIEFYGSVSWRKVYSEKEEHWPIKLAFGAPVYIIVDNSMHMIIMWLVFSQVMKMG